MERSRANSRLLAVASLVLLLATAAGCAGSSVNPNQGRREGPIRIGLIWPLSGYAKTAGDDYLRGWSLYLEEHGGKLGGFEIMTLTADEGDGRQAARDGIARLIEQDKVDVVVGTLSSDAVMAVNAAVTAAGIPYLATGGRPGGLTDLTYTWHVSWRQRDAGLAIADYIRENVDGPVWAIGPDYVGGHEHVGGFAEKYTAGGGKLANPDGKPTWTPFPATTNFAPYLNQILASEAKAVFAFYGGTMGVDFIKQYDLIIGDRIPLYVAGSTVDNLESLKAMGPAADGVYSSLNYAHDLDLVANREFARKFSLAYSIPPFAFNVFGWDAAMILDIALADAGPNPTPESINNAISRVSLVPSPRGDWRFGSDHAPNQTWYLRQVNIDGRVRANTVVDTLGILGPEG